MIKNRIISILLSLCMLFSIVPAIHAADAEEFTEGNLTYRIVDASNKTVEVSKVASVPTDGAIEIPAEISHSDATYTVIGIGNGAIGSNDSVAKSLKSVTMPQNSEAFTYIGSSAFQNCMQISSLTIPASVTRIGSIASGDFGDIGVFYGMSSLETVTFAENSKLETLGTNAFVGCEKLQGLAFPDNLKKVGGTIVSGCTTLSHLTIPASVDDLSPNAFLGFYSNENGAPNVTIETGGKYRLTDGILYGDTSLVKAYEYPEILIVPEGITSIEEYAFASSETLNTTTMSLVLPKSLSNLGTGAFTGCTALESIDFQGNTNLTTIPEEAFVGCSNLKELQIPSGVKSIESAAFYGCTGLQSISLPEGLESIGDLAFLMVAIEGGEPNMEKTNDNITSINIPSTVTFLGEMFLGGLKPDGGTVVVSQVKDPSIFTEDALAGITGEGMNKPTFYFPADAKDAYTGGDNLLLSTGLVSKPSEGGSTDPNKMFSITLKPTSTALNKGATVAWAIESSLPPVSKIEVTSSDPSVATAQVSTDGKSITITGVKAGTANITASIMMNGQPLMTSNPVTVTVETEKATVTYNSNGHGTAPESQDIALGDTITLPAMQNDGDWTFTGWTADDGTRYEAGASYTVTKAVTFTANWRYDGTIAPVKYDITITDSDHGVVEASAASAVSGKTITLTVTPEDGYHLERLTVTNRKGKEIDLTANGDGTYSFKMPAGKVTVTAVFAKDEEPTPEPTPELPFTDVVSGAWYYDAVQYVYGEGLMTGTSETLFSPELTTTRGMIVSILHRLEGSPVASDAGFTDVAAGAWYADAVNWVESVGVVSGCSDTQFGPNDPITREQFAAILYNYADYKGMDVSARTDLSKYSDAENISGWATDVLSWANAEGLVNGMTETTLVPQGQASRAQAAAILQRFLSE